jgi:hypothetical protein
MIRFPCLVSVSPMRLASCLGLLGMPGMRSCSGGSRRKHGASQARLIACNPIRDLQREIEYCGAFGYLPARNPYIPRLGGGGVGWLG